MLIDFHTHQFRSESEGISIRSIDIMDWTEKVPPFFSLGLHPWKLTESWLENFQEIKLLFKKIKPLALGEFGLDRIKGPDLKIQEKVFCAMVSLSEEIGLPCILHSVRSYEKIIYWHKNLKPNNKWIIHGFNGNKRIAFEFWNRGIYTSFGESIIRTVKSKEVFIESPLDMFFLETDESGKDIYEIYESASKIKNMQMEKIEKSILQNFYKIFGEIL